MQDRNGTKLSSSGSRFQPVVLLWATSASKIRCKVPLYVTVKGHWERSTTFTARLHCYQWHHIVTHYLQAKSKDRQPKHPLSILLPCGQCKFCFSVFSSLFLIKVNYNHVTPHSELALLPRAKPVRVARLLTTIPRHLIVTKCRVKLSTGSACLWCTERRQQHSRLDPKHESPQPPIQRIQQAFSACISKSYNSCYILYIDKLASGWYLHLHTNTCF